jgi:hypothetical protein
MLSRIGPPLYMNPSSAGTTVYVMGAYVPNGGTLMAYHLARIVHVRFGVPEWCFCL